MKRLLFSLALITSLLLTGCMTSTNLHIMKPAVVTVPQNIKKIGLVNRTLPKSNIGNILEGVLTGEGIGQDKQGVSKVLEGLHNTLNGSERYEVSMTPLELVGSGTGGTFPAALPWSEVEKICKDYGVDAIAVIETYDSDYIITNGSKEVEKKGEDGKVYKEIEYTAEGVATVKMGFRLYDPVNKRIVDQDQFEHRRRWAASGNSASDVALQLMAKRNAVNIVSNYAGEQYGKRIAPVYQWVTRSYYKKSKKNFAFESGVRKSEVNNWHGAIEDWEAAHKAGDRKTKGKAAYNIAIAYEVEGDLEGAKMWAQKSYADYGNKKARSYVSILEQRLRDYERLKEQMGHNEEQPQSEDAE